MQQREPAWPGTTDTPEAARARLASALRQSAHAPSQQVQGAFALVPRHIFVPEAGPSAAYRDQAFVIKCDADGLPVSSSSQPAMMAIMLDQLKLEPGHRVLEIGTGSGYNAAVMSAVVGSLGTVVSVDIDADLVARARSSLTAAGYGTVLVRCADGGYGYPADAPFDRIIVTAGAWDVAPAWLDQLSAGGVLVVPLSVRGIQLSVALERSGGSWLSTSAWRCGFVRMLGAFAGPDAVLLLDGPQPLYAQMADGSPVDAPALHQALAGPAVAEQLELPAISPMELADLDLWLTVTEPALDRVTLLAAPGGWLQLAPLLPFGGLVSQATAADSIGIAVLLPVQDEQQQADRRTASAGFVRGYGPGGAALAGHLAARACDWSHLGRPGTADLCLTVRQPGGPSAVRAGSYRLNRPHAVIELGWPGNPG